MPGRHPPSAVVWMKVVSGITHVVSANIKVESLVFGIEFILPTDMPFAHESGCIASLLERLSDRDFFQRKIFSIGCFNHRKRFFNSSCTLDWNCVRDVQATGIFSSQNAGTRWRTDATRGIRISESHALFRQSINVRGFVITASVTTQVCPSQIVYEDKDNIEAFR